MMKRASDREAGWREEILYEGRRRDLGFVEILCFYVKDN